MIMIDQKFDQIPDWDDVHILLERFGKTMGWWRRDYALYTSDYEIFFSGTVSRALSGMDMVVAQVYDIESIYLWDDRDVPKYRPLTTIEVIRLIHHPPGELILRAVWDRLDMLRRVKR